LKNSEVPPNYSAKGLKQASEKLRVEQLSETERKEYQRYKESRWIEKDVLETAERKGAIKQKIVIAKNLLHNNFSDEDIANYTGLSIDNIAILRAGGEIEDEK
jgi:predicted transposase/invertase (TIGR01784 family)